MNFRKCKCIECGYLCFELIEQRFLGEQRPWGALQQGIPEYERTASYREITAKERNEDLELRRGSKNLFCYRREVSFEVELEAILKRHESSESKECSELDNLINKTRKCRYYTSYIPGYSPLQHLTRWEAVERERSNRRWSLLYIIIGAIITALGALAIKLIFR
jgi:hypothetical protein